MNQKVRFGKLYHGPSEQVSELRSGHTAARAPELKDEASNAYTIKETIKETSTPVKKKNFMYAEQN